MAYHHGDLRRALLAAAVAAIEERGPAAISLRDLARRANVSHAAPAHHFGDKAGLLAAPGPAPSPIAALAAWSLVHGLATLWLSGSLRDPPTDDPEELTRLVAAVLFRDGGPPGLPSAG